MKKKQKQKTFEDAVAYLRAHAFDVQQDAAAASRVEVRKYDCGAVLTRGTNESTLYTKRPGCIMGGEIATIVDRGYQKFLHTSRGEFPATADHLRALHQFTEELHEAAGTIDLYNEALGTVSDLYLYDRLKGRENTTPSSGH